MCLCLPPMLFLFSFKSESILHLVFAYPSTLVQSYIVFSLSSLHSSFLSDALVFG